MIRLLIVLVLALAAADARADETLTVNYFPGPTLGPVFAGIERGAFAKEGLSVTAEPTQGSVAQMTALLTGKCQIAFGGLDDAVAYDVGEGEVPIAARADAIAIMGTDSGSLHLVTAADVTSVEGLKGRTVAVDAKSTGFAFVLYHILALHGLKAGDYTVLSVGSSQKRVAALTQGAAQGLVTFKPVADQLAVKGFHDLVTASDVLPHYQAASILVRRSWAKAHRRALIGFIRAYVASARWFFDPANKDAAIGVLMRSMQLSHDAAEAAYEATPNPGRAIGRIDPAGAAALVRLREQYAEPRKPLGDPRQFYDLSYFRAALQR
jgi:ABC-type nitrate/sulfonate/bicarbonate transport system substrate-binding protein